MHAYRYEMIEKLEIVYLKSSKSHQIILQLTILLSTNRLLSCYLLLSSSINFTILTEREKTKVKTPAIIETALNRKSLLWII